MLSLLPAVACGGDPVRREAERVMQRTMPAMMEIRTTLALTQKACDRAGWHRRSHRHLACDRKGHRAADSGNSQVVEGVRASFVASVPDCATGSSRHDQR